MVTRAVNFKIIVPCGKKDQSVAQALWTTHREINQATRYYEELLLSLRQRLILYRDDSESSETEAAQIARDLADVAWRINNRNTLSNHTAAKIFRVKEVEILIRKCKILSSVLYWQCIC